MPALDTLLPGQPLILLTTVGNGVETGVIFTLPLLSNQQTARYISWAVITGAAITAVNIDIQVGMIQTAMVTIDNYTVATGADGYRTFGPINAKFIRAVQNSSAGADVSVITMLI